MMFEAKASAKSRLRLVVAASALLGLGATAQADSGPFAGLSGQWSGTGTITISGGSKERLRCRADYSTPPSGGALHQSLRCASDSYKFEVNSNVVAEDGGKLSGTWTELTRQVTGQISGRVSPGMIDVSVNGTVFTAAITIHTKNNGQAVDIRPQGGTDVQEVKIEMHRV